MAKKKLKTAKNVQKSAAQEPSVKEPAVKDERIKDKKATMLGNERLVNNITWRNMLIYFMVAVIPPVGLYFLWFRENTIPDSARYLWTLIGFAVLYQWFLMLTGNPNAVQPAFVPGIHELI